MGSCPFCGSKRDTRCGSAAGRMYFECNSWDAGERKEQSVQCKLEVLDRELKRVDRRLEEMQKRAEQVFHAPPVDVPVVRTFDFTKPEWDS